MDVYGTGRLYAPGNLSWNLCKYRFTGFNDRCVDFVCMGFLFERGLDMEKLYDSCSWNGVMCIILLQCIRLDIMQLFPVLPNDSAVQGRTIYAESPFSLWQRCGNCRCDSCNLRLVVCAQCNFI